MTDNPADEAEPAEEEQPALQADIGAAPPQPMPPQLDTRRLAVRRDLAALSLRGSFQAPRYSAGVTRQILRPTAPLRRQPDASLGFETEVLHGELVTVFDETDGWAWVQLQRDHYVGYLPSDVLTADIRTATHRVRALGTFVYPVADIKSPPVMHLSLNSQLRVAGGADAADSICMLERGGFVVRRHLIETTRHERDFVDVAERLIGTPYLWGGRTRVGIDCSGLVQTALEAAGVACPRDSDMQASELGESVPIPRDLEGLQRGDLVFWTGHVGIMVDAVMLVHANAHHMAVAVEALPAAAGRIARQGSDIKAVRRLAPPAAPGAAQRV